MWLSSRMISVRRVDRRHSLMGNNFGLTLGLISQVAEELWEVKGKKIRNLTKVITPRASRGSLSAFDVTSFPPHRKELQSETTRTSCERSPRLRSRKRSCSRRVLRRKRCVPEVGVVSVAVVS